MEYHLSSQPPQQQVFFKKHYPLILADMRAWLGLTTQTDGRQRLAEGQKAISVALPQDMPEAGSMHAACESATLPVIGAWAILHSQA